VVGGELGPELAEVPGSTSWGVALLPTPVLIWLLGSLSLALPLTLSLSLSLTGRKRRERTVSNLVLRALAAKTPLDQSKFPRIVPQLSTGIAGHLWSCVGVLTSTSDL